MVGIVSRQITDVASDKAPRAPDDGAQHFAGVAQTVQIERCFLERQQFLLASMIGLDQVRPGDAVAGGREALLLRCQLLLLHSAGLCGTLRLCGISHKKSIRILSSTLYRQRRRPYVSPHQAFPNAEETRRSTLNR